MPKIGIPLCYDYIKGNDENIPILYIVESVRRSIQKAGGDVLTIVPVQDFDYMTTSNSDFPPLTNSERKRINVNLDHCDGLFLPGGRKFTRYNQYILDYAIKKDIPTLGVCLSMQMMGCYKEDVKLEKNETSINHNQNADQEFCHNVKILKNSKLYQIIGQEEIKVNSFHDYHILENHIYKTVAKSPDGIIEAIEHPTATFNIGLQWHPERSYTKDVNSKLIIDYFINEAIKYSKRKQKDIKTL